MPTSNSKKTGDRGSRSADLPRCRACAFGTCCTDGVEVDLFEVARILRAPLRLPKPWFAYLGRDKRLPSGFKFSTVVRQRRCVFQDDFRRCRIYAIRPQFCVEFPLENGRKAPYYHVLCHHGRKKKP